MTDWNFRLKHRSAGESDTGAQSGDHAISAKRCQIGPDQKIWDSERGEQHQPDAEASETAARQKAHEGVSQREQEKDSDVDLSESQCASYGADQEKRDTGPSRGSPRGEKNGGAEENQHDLLGMSGFVSEYNGQRGTGCENRGGQEKIAPKTVKRAGHEQRRQEPVAQGDEAATIDRKS